MAAEQHVYRSAVADWGRAAPRGLGGAMPLSAGTCTAGELGALIGLFWDLDLFDSIESRTRRIRSSGTSDGGKS